MMSSSTKHSHGLVTTSRDMGHVLGQGKGPTQQQNLIQDKYKVGHPFGQPYLDTNCELKQNARTEKAIQSNQSKSSEHDRKSWHEHKTCNDDELVKHMSNLPGFLQQVEKKNSIQEKALNFGVLDWKRLEKWKYNERMPGKYPKKASSTSSNSFCSTSGTPKTSSNLKKLPSSHGVNPSSLYSGKQPISHSSRFSSPQRQPLPYQSSHLNSSKEEKNVIHHKEEKYVGGIKSREKETCNQEFQVAQSRPMDKQQDNFHKKMKFYKNSGCKTNLDNDKKKDTKKEMMSEKEASSPEKVNGLGRKSETRLVDKVNSTDSKNVVFLEPEHFSRSSHFKSRASVDGKLSEAIENRLSDCFSPLELDLSEFSDDIPHSCPLPSGATLDTESTLEPHNLVTSQAIDLNICTSARPSLSDEASDKTQSGVRGRPPSPTRRFSFNLGRMSRSFSFKESSAIPQLSSQYTAFKSGPVCPEVSPSIDNPERDKANPNSRARSSPLRRLLDPLLKYKGAQSSESIRPPNKSLHSTSFQALMQLTLKNGLPFFKFVVDNSSDMLAAVVKKLPTSGKSDSCLTFVFYSVHEVRKKSMNWMNQGSKSKSCSLGYNIVGQMKISSSYARECVLYEVDEQKPEFVPSKEIAAIVVKKAIERVNNMVVVLPGGVHGIPVKGKPSSLINRWRSNGSCDCGGWDIGCKLRILNDNNKSSSSSATDRFSLYMQGEEGKSKPIFSLEPFNNEFYSIELDTSMSLLEAFATCVAYLTCRNFSEILDTKDSDNMKKPADLQGQVPAKYMTCPPASPVGRI
ncbi:hypothetical protein ACJIZ3_022090 [Penstemon smallii]|uniref:Uncharacterized protein n=1 Tax=Penstemon smallii TaxID=265156 RepID=A0ABD3SNY5_9LAMI